MSELFTRENITLALSIFGSIGALVTFVSSFVTKRKNLKINLVSYAYRKDLHWLILVISFENRSQLPIAITSISAILNGQEISPIPYPHCVSEYTHRFGLEVIDKKFEYNLKLPADIQQLSSVSGYVLLDVSPKEFENLSTPLTLLVHSTRGRVQKIELQLDQIK